LIEIRNGMVLERKVIGKDDDGNPIEVDVVPSIKDLIACCKEILNRAVGMPSQEVDLNSKHLTAGLIPAFLIRVREMVRGHAKKTRAS
jgi:hypothetical protein